MIVLDNVSKVYPTKQGPRTVFDRVNLKIAKGEKLGILGRNGAGKSTLIRLISGAERPTTGHISRGISISWPLAFGGAFQGSLTGLDNLRFICRIYDAPIEPAIAFVKDFSELGDYLREPVKVFVWYEGKACIRNFYGGRVRLFFNRRNCGRGRQPLS